jgi:hypothetical protein
MGRGRAGSCLDRHCAPAYKKMMLYYTNPMRHTERSMKGLAYTNALRTVGMTTSRNSDGHTRHAPTCHGPARDREGAASRVAPRGADHEPELRPTVIHHPMRQAEP